MKKLMNKKGFTLMEMLIVVAIIVILVAVAMPTFTSSLNEAKANTDKANLRAAKAVANAMEMTDGWGKYLSAEAEDGAVFEGELYFDVDAGEFVDASKKESHADKGQSTGYVNSYITITIEDGELQGEPIWK